MSHRPHAEEKAEGPADLGPCRQRERESGTREKYEKGDQVEPTAKERPHCWITVSKELPNRSRHNNRGVETFAIQMRHKQRSPPVPAYPEQAGPRCLAPQPMTQNIIANQPLLCHEMPANKGL